MDDHASPNPLLRRKSVAGPYMRSSMGIPPEHRPAGAAATAPSASTATTTPPAPLTRANTHSGGWFGGWFGRRSSISNSASGIPRPPEDTIEDNYAHLASSAPQVLPPKADSRDALLSSTGGPRPTAPPAAGQSPAATTGAAPPPLARRLSEVALQRPGTKNGAGATTTPNNGATAIATSPTPKPSLLETDIRQGPIETDLFWLVLRDIGE